MRAASSDIQASPRVASFLRHLPETLGMRAESVEQVLERADALLALRELENAQREAICLRYICGLSWDRVAARMGIGRKVARRLESHALDALEGLV